ncbi:MAG TPA: MarR family transcriptional regulator [Gemmatimonadales bacterium]|nr:MarR family transcriptional regulator [Gemmatimonadales bacterium]
MTQPSPLTLLLELSRAQARLVRRLDGRLGALHGLSFGDFAILRHLALAPERKLRRVDLAEALGLTPAAVTRALIPLEKIGLVKRAVDKHDARVGFASLTRAGEQLLSHATEAADQASAEALSADATQLGELSRLVAKLL